MGQSSYARAQTLDVFHRLLRVRNVVQHAQAITEVQARGRDRHFLGSAKMELNVRRVGKLLSRYIKRRSGRINAMKFANEWRHHLSPPPRATTYINPRPVP